MLFQYSRTRTGSWLSKGKLRLQSRNLESNPSNRIASWWNYKLRTKFWPRNLPKWSRNWNHKLNSTHQRPSPRSKSTRTKFVNLKRTRSTWPKSMRRSGICTVVRSSHLWTPRWCGRSWTWSVTSWLSASKGKMIRLSSTNKGWPSSRLTSPLRIIRSRRVRVTWVLTRPTIAMANLLRRSLSWASCSPSLLLNPKT